MKKTPIGRNPPPPQKFGQERPRIYAAAESQKDTSEALRNLPLPEFYAVSSFSLESRSRVFILTWAKTAKTSLPSNRFPSASNLRPWLSQVFSTAAARFPARTFPLSGRLAIRADFRDGDGLVFGNEGHGAPAWLHEFVGKDFEIKIPQPAETLRSLNLSTAAGIAAYEALRQITRGA